MDIYDYLIDNGADPNLQDSFGNTALHMAVIADQPVSTKGSMYTNNQSILLYLPKFSFEGI